MQGIGTELGFASIGLIIALMGFIIKLLKYANIKPFDVIRNNKPKKGDITNTALLKSLDNPGCKPGTAQVCIDNGKMLTEHATIINQLCKWCEESKLEAREFRQKVREDFKTVFDKIDDLRNRI